MKICFSVRIWGFAGGFLARFGGGCGVANTNALNMFDNRSRVVHPTL